MLEGGRGRAFVMTAAQLMLIIKFTHFECEAKGETPNISVSQTFYFIACNNNLDERFN